MKTLKKKISLVALVSGLIAIIIAISTSSGGVYYEAETVSLSEKGKGYLKEKIFGEKQEVSNKREFKIDNPGVFILGIIAVIVSFLTFFIREAKNDTEKSGFHIDFDAAGAALSIGLAALLWNYILVAIIIAIVLYILINVLAGGIDISF